MNESSKATEAASYAATASEAWTWTAEQLADLNAKLDRPFGGVDRYNQALAFTLWMDGHPVQWLHNFGPHEQWKNAEPGINLWGRGMRLRILPKPEVLVLPSIDWSHVQPIWKWLVQDKYEVPLLFCEKPETNGTAWGIKGPSLLATHFASFKPGRGDWKKLIVERTQ